MNTWAWTGLPGAPTIREAATLAEVIQLLPRWTQQDWMADGICQGQTELFFPPFGEQADARAAREAVAASICGECPVIEECRAYARHHREQGFWGGENDEQRLEARRRSSARRAPGEQAAAAGGG